MVRFTDLSSVPDPGGLWWSSGGGPTTVDFVLSQITIICEHSAVQMFHYRSAGNISSPQFQEQKDDTLHRTCDETQQRFHLLLVFPVFYSGVVFGHYRSLPHLHTYFILTIISSSCVLYYRACEIKTKVWGKRQRTKGENPGMFQEHLFGTSSLVTGSVSQNLRCGTYTAWRTRPARFTQ